MPCPRPQRYGPRISRSSLLNSQSLACVNSDQALPAAPIRGPPPGPEWPGLTSLLSSSVPPLCPMKPGHLCPCWVGPANGRLGSPPRRARPFWGLTTEMPNIWGSLRPDGATHHGELTVLEHNQQSALLSQPSLLWGIVVSPVALLTAPPCPSATLSPVPCAGPGQATSSLSGWAWLSFSPRRPCSLGDATLFTAPPVLAQSRGE